MKRLTDLQYNDLTTKRLRNPPELHLHFYIPILCISYFAKIHKMNIFKKKIKIDFFYKIRVIYLKIATFPHRNIQKFHLELFSINQRTKLNICECGYIKIKCKQPFSIEMYVFMSFIPCLFIFVFFFYSTNFSVDE